MQIRATEEEGAMGSPPRFKHARATGERRYSGIASLDGLSSSGKRQGARATCDLLVERGLFKSADVVTFNHRHRSFVCCLESGSDPSNTLIYMYSDCSHAWGPV